MSALAGTSLDPELLLPWEGMRLEGAKHTAQDRGPSRLLLGHSWEAAWIIQRPPKEWTQVSLLLLAFSHPDPILVCRSKGSVLVTALWPLEKTDRFGFNSPKAP